MGRAWILLWIVSGLLAEPSASPTIAQSAGPSIEDLCPEFLPPDHERELFLGGANCDGVSATLDGAAIQVLAATPTSCLFLCPPLPSGIHTINLAGPNGAASVNFQARDRIAADCLPLFDCIINSVLRGRASDLIRSDGIERSLLTKIEKARASFVEGNFFQSLQKVRVFSNETDAQAGHEVDSAFAGFLSRLVDELLIPCIRDEISVCLKPEFTLETEYIDIVEKETEKGKPVQRRVNRTFKVDKDDATVTYTSRFQKTETEFGRFALKLKPPVGEDSELCLCWYCYFPEDDAKHELSMKQTDIGADLKKDAIVVQCGTHFLWVACKHEPKTEEAKKNCCDDFTWVQLIKQRRLD